MAVPAASPRLTADPRGHFFGPMAHAYACGAQMAVTNEAPWNIVFASCSCCGVEEKREMLRESWGVHDPAEWRATLEGLLDERSSDQGATLVMDIRWQTAQWYRRPIDPATWQAAVGDWCRRNGQADIHAPLIETVERILRYEARLTADGVLPYGAVIRDMIAYDFGRAVNFARWGVHAEYTDPATAESFILHAGVQSRRFYSSWAHLSAGYILGRCLRFDEDEFGPYYTGPVAAHHALMQDPQSPWLNLPFQM